MWWNAHLAITQFKCQPWKTACSKVLILSHHVHQWPCDHGINHMVIVCLSKSLPWFNVHFNHHHPASLASDHRRPMAIAHAPVRCTSAGTLLWGVLAARMADISASVGVSLPSSSPPLLPPPLTPPPQLPNNNNDATSAPWQWHQWCPTLAMLAHHNTAAPPLIEGCGQHIGGYGWRWDDPGGPVRRETHKVHLLPILPTFP